MASLDIRRSRRELLAGALGAGALGVLGCGSTVRPAAAPTSDVPSAGKFPHGLLSLVLSKAVSPAGLVDYATVASEVSSLDSYLAELARVSPPTQKHLFPTEEDALAYWINGHNAGVLKAVLVLGRPADMAASGGALERTSFVFGGKTLSLGAVVGAARRFADPRIHFVLVKARRGGPRLRAEAYEPTAIHADLEAAARAFVNDPRNIAWEPPAAEARLSRVILDHRGDFERQARASVSGDARLLLAVNRWRERGRDIVATRVGPLPLDERLNAA